MGTLTKVLTIVAKDCFMARNDLTDSYYAVPVALDDQKYLLFWVDGQLCIYVCPHHGLTSATRIFRKLFFLL